MRVLLLVLLAVACRDPLGHVPSEPFTPPPMFAEWWAAMERCSGERGDLARIRWYVAPSLPADEGYLTYGRWWWPHHIALLSEVVSHTDGSPPWQPWAQRVVMHEMLHDLTGPRHGAVFDRCGVRSIS